MAIVFTSLAIRRLTEVHRIVYDLTNCKQTVPTEEGGREDAGGSGGIPPAWQLHLASAQPAVQGKAIRNGKHNVQAEA